MSNIYNNAIFVTSADKMPSGEHWAIVEFSSFTVPGDERSRTAPGHGYPEHQQTTVEYRAYLTREDFEAEMQERAARPSCKSFRCIHVSGVISARPTFHLEERA